MCGLLISLIPPLVLTLRFFPLSCLNVNIPFSLHPPLPFFLQRVSLDVCWSGTLVQLGCFSFPFYSETLTNPSVQHQTADRRAESLAEGGRRKKKVERLAAKQPRISLGTGLEQNKVQS